MVTLDCVTLKHFSLKDTYRWNSIQFVGAYQHPDIRTTTLCSVVKHLSTVLGIPSSIPSAAEEKKGPPTSNIHQTTAAHELWKSAKNPFFNNFQLKDTNKPSVVTYAL